MKGQGESPKSMGSSDDSLDSSGSSNGRFRNSLGIDLSTQSTSFAPVSIPTQTGIFDNRRASDFSEADAIAFQKHFGLREMSLVTITNEDLDLDSSSSADEEYFEEFASTKGKIETVEEGRESASSVNAESLQSGSFIKDKDMPVFMDTSKASQCVDGYFLKSSFLRALLCGILSLGVMSIVIYAYIYHLIPEDLLGNNLLYASSYSEEKVKIKIIPNTLKYLADVTRRRHKKAATPFLWDIPYSTSTQTLEIFGKCYELTQASKLNAKIYEHGSALHLVNMGGMSYVNVNLNSPADIQRAFNKGLLESNLADVIVSPYLHLVAGAFTRQQLGLAFVILRNPLQRFIDRYKNLLLIHQKQSSQFTVESFLEISSEQNWLTRQLTNENLLPLTELHLEQAKQVLRTKFIIGLDDNIQESFRRFKEYFEWRSLDFSCEQYLLKQPYHTKTSGYVFTAEEISLVSDNNFYDLELFDYAKQLFHEQGENFFEVEMNVN